MREERKKGEREMKKTQCEMVVKLSSCGNPDYYQDQNEAMSPGRQYGIKTLKQASEICKFYIIEFDLGGGNWTGGQVLLKGKQIAEVSYNGRVWDMDGKEIQI